MGLQALLPSQRPRCMALLGPAPCSHPCRWPLVSAEDQTRRRVRVERNIYRRPSGVLEVGFKDGRVDGGITAARARRDELLARRGRGAVVPCDWRVRFRDAADQWLNGATALLEPCRSLEGSRCSLLAASWLLATRCRPRSCLRRALAGRSASAMCSGRFGTRRGTPPIATAARRSRPSTMAMAMAAPSGRR